MLFPALSTAIHTGSVKLGVAQAAGMANVWVPLELNRYKTRLTKSAV